MKLIYVVIDGMGDLPTKKLGNETPLGAAETPNLDTLARNGRTGLMYTVGRGIAPESDVAVISILGYDPFKYATGRGVLEAVGAGIAFNDGELALRCNFATLGKRGRILDRRVGRNLTTEEAENLSNTINEEVTLSSYPANFEFKNTIGHRAVLVIRSKKTLSSKITNTDPAYTRVQELGVAEKKVKMIMRQSRPMNKSREAEIAATLVNEFVQKSHDVLEKHVVNRERAAEGKLEANAMLTRDAGSSLPVFFDIGKKYGARFACLADMAVERGIAKLAGMYLVDLPPPSRDLKSDSVSRVKKLTEELPNYDCFYIHIKGPDEPGHDGDCELKKRLIATIDRYFFGKLLDKIKPADCLICVTADHATPCVLKAHSDDPVPLLISGGKTRGDNHAKFSEKECANGSLGTLRRGTQLMPMLMDIVSRKGA